MPGSVDVDDVDDDEYNLESYVTEDFQCSTVEDIHNSSPGSGSTNNQLGDSTVGCEQRAAVRMSSCAVHFLAEISSAMWPELHAVMFSCSPCVRDVVSAISMVCIHRFSTNFG